MAHVDNIFTNAVYKAKLYIFYSQTFYSFYKSLLNLGCLLLACLEYPQSEFYTQLAENKNSATWEVSLSP